jgi:hypothetical protein
MSIKKRPGFRPIDVDGRKYTFAVVLGKRPYDRATGRVLNNGCIVCYDEDDKKSILSFDRFPDTPSARFKPTKAWHGKNKAAGWGKPEVAEMIRHCLHSK